MSFSFSDDTTDRFLTNSLSLAIYNLRPSYITLASFLMKAWMSFHATWVCKEWNRPKPAHKFIITAPSFISFTSSILVKQIQQSRTSLGDQGTMNTSIIYKEAEGFLRRHYLKKENTGFISDDIFAVSYSAPEKVVLRMDERTTHMLCSQSCSFCFSVVYSGQLYTDISLCFKCIPFVKYSTQLL